MEDNEFKEYNAPQIKICENSILYNKTYNHTLTNYNFGNIPESKMIEIYRDGRAFSHFIEPWLAVNYPLIHITGCKNYDHTDTNNVKYEQKTFTKGGCKFMPSNMIGTKRKFNKDDFQNTAKKLIYIIICNIKFPKIKIKFIKGTDLILNYPNGIIPLKDFDKFFN